MKTKDIVNQYDCKGSILKYFSRIGGIDLKLVKVILTRK